jgi:hypothetical protein
VDELDQLLRGKRPRRHWRDARLLAGRG